MGTPLDSLTPHSPTAPGSTADSGEGDFDYASASGDGSGAGTGTGSFDAAIASGTDSGALAGGTTIADASGTNTYLGDEDFAYALGSHTIAYAGGLVVTKVPKQRRHRPGFRPVWHRRQHRLRRRRQFRPRRRLWRHAPRGRYRIQLLGRHPAVAFGAKMLRLNRFQLAPGMNSSPNS